MKFIRQASAFLILTMLTAFGCSGTSRPAPPPDGPSPFPDLGIACSNYPLVDGSTSTQPLGRFIACRILDAGYQWNPWNSDDTRRLYASEWSLFADSEYDGSKRELCDWINAIVQHRGTHSAYVNLIEGRADLILVAREPSLDESQIANDRQIALDVEAIALDAFVFLLNTANPVEQLTVDQIRDIYTGRIVNWMEVGGPDAEITPFQRNRNSGSQELMERLVMKDLQMIRAPDMMVGTSMAEPFTMLDKNPHGIGYTVYFYHEHMAPAARVKACAVNGVLPEPRTIADGTYPLVTRVYAAIRDDSPADSPARKLRDWLLSPTGQAIVGQCGYVPVGETDPEAQAEPSHMRFR
jgi:phosphate transport system substrate-binding protein